MKRKNIKNKVKEYFFEHPTQRLRVRHIERKAGITLPSAIRYAKELEIENILKSQVIAGVKLYSAYRSSPRFLLEKRFFNIISIIESGLVDFLVDSTIPDAIILFGSFAKGEDIEDSDINIYVQTKKTEIGVKDFEKKLGKSIQIFAFNSIHDIKNKHLSNNILNGSNLYGFVEVFDGEGGKLE